jgi:signal transduction histidine kinase
MASESAPGRPTSQDLEQFAWSVSHDLRAPLRAVSGFLDIFREENDSKLDGRARELLDLASGGCGRMAEMIDGLLQLSNLAPRPLRREPVDLSAIAMRVVSDLQALDPGRVVNVLLSPGLVVPADRPLVTLVLQNLIGNAWKFTGRTASPRIEVGRTGEWIYVRDNGAGFDPATAAGLFTPFQRFHSREEFEGSGIGLATVGKIIRRHGGTIRVDAVPGKGATFYFTLPSGP